MLLLTLVDGGLLLALVQVVLPVLGLCGVGKTNGGVDKLASRQSAQTRGKSRLTIHPPVYRPSHARCLTSESVGSRRRFSGITNSLAVSLLWTMPNTWVRPSHWQLMATSAGSSFTLAATHPAAGRLGGRLLALAAAAPAGRARRYSHGTSPSLPY